MVSNLSLGGFMVVVVVLGCFRGWFYFFLTVKWISQGGCGGGFRMF